MMISNTQNSAPIVHRPLCFLVRMLAIVLAILGVAGCASISPAPFTALTTSIQELRDGADASLSLAHERTRDRYIAEAAAGNVAKVEGLLLTQPAGDPFGWASPDPPLFLKVARFKDGVHRLNSVLVGYAGLLGQLASPDLVSSEKFEQLAKDLNDNLRTSVQALGVSAASNKEIAIFSMLGTAAFQAYLKNKQRSSLLEALNSNQPAIQEAAELGASAVRITAAALRNEYNHSSAKLASSLRILNYPTREGRRHSENSSNSTKSLSRKSPCCGHFISLMWRCRQPTKSLRQGWLTLNVGFQWFSNFWRMLASSTVCTMS